VVNQVELREQYYVYIQEEFQNLGYEETYKHLIQETYKSIKQVFEDCRSCSHKEFKDYESFKKGAENALYQFRTDVIKKEIEKEIEARTQ
jgi:hypothetical protein